jgi:hypothetical protein
MVDRSLEVFLATAVKAVCVGAPQVVLSHRPFSGEVLAGLQCKSLFVVMNGALEIVSDFIGPLFLDALRVGVREIVLCSRPGLWEAVSAVNLESFLMVVNSTL